MLVACPSSLRLPLASRDVGQNDHYFVIKLPQPLLARQEPSTRSSASTPLWGRQRRPGSCAHGWKATTIVCQCICAPRSHKCKCYLPMEYAGSVLGNGHVSRYVSNIEPSLARHALAVIEGKHVR
eukprot:3218710-Amphidinium_carterae.1